MEDAPLSISDTTNDDDAGHESTDDADDADDDDEELHHLEVDDPPEEETTIEESEPTPPRPTRNRVKPKWTEDYVMSLQSPEWLNRAKYFQSLVTSGVLETMDKDSAKALIAIVTGK